MCYEQFEKLRAISDSNQIFITTHWYGFLPILSEGYGHFLTYEDDKISFESYDLYDYKAKVKSQTATSKGKFPSNFILKSTNDLVQASYYSIQGDEPYNWLLVEGISEKIYFEYFFKNEIEANKLRILALGGNNHVSEAYEYLELPMREKNDAIKGKIWALIDTDQTRHKEHIKEGTKNLKLRRLSNKNSNIKTELLTLNNSDTSTTDIEQALNPVIFQKSISKLSSNEKYLVSIIIDDAKKNKINHGWTTGGMISAPVAGRVISRMAPIVGIPPRKLDDKDLKESLSVVFKPRYKRNK